MRTLNSNGLHILAIGAIVLVALAGTAKAADLTVSDTWILASPAGVPSGGYFTLHNGGGKAVTLTGANSPACGMLMLHQSEDVGGMASMHDVTSVSVPAGGTVKFSPGGYHLMCMEAKRAIKPGATVPVTLNFKDGSRLEVRFAVRNAAGK